MSNSPIDEYIANSAKTIAKMLAHQSGQYAARFVQEMSGEIQTAIAEAIDRVYEIYGWDTADEQRASSDDSHMRELPIPHSPHSKEGL